MQAQCCHFACSIHRWKLRTLSWCNCTVVSSNEGLSLSKPPAILIAKRTEFKTTNMFEELLWFVLDIFSCLSCCEANQFFALHCVSDPCPHLHVFQWAETLQFHQQWRPAKNLKLVFQRFVECIIIIWHPKKDLVIPSIYHQFGGPFGTWIVMLHGHRAPQFGGLLMDNSSGRSLGFQPIQSLWYFLSTGYVKFCCQILIVQGCKDFDDL